MTDIERQLLSNQLAMLAAMLMRWSLPAAAESALEAAHSATEAMLDMVEPGECQCPYWENRMQCPYNVEGRCANSGRIAPKGALRRGEPG